MNILKCHKFIVISDQAIFSGTSFVFTILLARILSIESFGTYSGYILAIYLVLSCSGAFVIQPFQVLIGKSKNKQQYVSFAIWLQVSIVGLIALIGFLISALFSIHFPIWVLGFGVGFLFHDFGRKLLLSLARPVQALFLDIVISICLLVSLYVFFKFGEGKLVNLYWYLSMAYIPSFVVLLILIKPFSIKKANALVYFSEHISQGKWLFLTAISQWWSGNLFVVASGIYLGPAALGVLRLAQSLMGIINVLLQTFENYILPQTAQKINIELSEGLSFLTSVSRKAGLLFFPILLISYLFAQQILILTGGEAYSSFGFVLQGMSLLYLLVFLSQPIRLLIRALMLNKHFFYGYLLSLGFALAFGHLLLSNYGLNGALMGLAISQILLIVYWTIILQKKKNLFMEIIHVVLGKSNPNRLNGVNKVVYNLATEQTKLGRNVQVWGITSNPVHDYPERNFKTVLFQSARLSFMLDKALQKSIKENHKAVFHLHGGWIPVFSSLARFFAKHQIKYVLTPHGAYNEVAMQRSSFRKKVYFNLFEKALLRNVYQVHSIGSSEVDGLKKIYPKAKSFLLPYGFESATSDVTPIKNIDFTIGFVGRLDIYTKGLDLLLEAFAIFQKSRPNSKLWIIGEGEGKSYIENFIQEKGLKNVVLWGKKFGKEKNDLINKMHVFAHPSRNEGLPTSVLEAASFGTPTIVSHATNLAEYVSAYQAGIFIENDNIDALVQGMITLEKAFQTEEAIKYSVGAKRMLEEVFSWSVLVKKYDELYK